MSDNTNPQTLNDEELEEVSGGYIKPSTWAAIGDMAREKKKEGMDFNQFYAYLRQWRAETQMEGYTTDNLDRDFESLVDYVYEEWKHF